MRSLLILFILTLIGCQGDGSDITKLTKELQESVDNYKRKVESLAPEGEKLTGQATEEVEKLFTFEYEVFSVAANSPAAAQREMLNKIGEERWECFAVELQGDKRNFYCKRKPKSYLRLIPRMFP